MVRGTAAVALILATACTGGTRILTAPDDGMPTGGGRSTVTPSIVGVWNVTVATYLDGITQVRQTTWTFSADQGCRLYWRVHWSAGWAVEQHTRFCRWSTNGSRVRIDFLDNGSSYESEFSFPGGDTGRLRFEGNIYTRIG